MNERLTKVLAEIERIAKEELKMDYFPIRWEVVPEEVLLEVMSYGLPTKFRHWEFGQSYDYQKAMGDMGQGKVYELIINASNPVAFLLESNSDVANILVLAHCLGHSSVFSYNYLFKKTDREMVSHAAERAERVDNYINLYGIEEVEKVMDIALAMERCIDWNKGEFREKYPEKKKIYKKRIVNEFEDLNFASSASPIKVVIENELFPPRPEYDLLWFFSNYSKNLEDWQKDIFEIVRADSFYFYPQILTKRINEGLAVLAHVHIVNSLSEEFFSPEDYLEFLKIHEKVVQPGGDPLNINPYFLGFTILESIKKEYDKLYEEGKSKITGFQKACEIVYEEDDISFIKNYLTKELSEELNLFTYKQTIDNYGETIEIESRDLDEIKEMMVRDLYNCHSPLISIVKASNEGIELEHNSVEFGTLDLRHLKVVMSYIQQLWGGIVDMKTIDKDGRETHYTYDEEGFSA